MKLRATWLIAAVWAIGAMGLARSANTRPDEPVSLEVSREQAAQEILKRYGGSARVVRADSVNQGGRLIYVFRLLSGSGKVWIVRIDAHSGAEVP